jgi:hypothetical protein
MGWPNLNVTLVDLSPTVSFHRLHEEENLDISLSLPHLPISRLEGGSVVDDSGIISVNILLCINSNVCT